MILAKWQFQKYGNLKVTRPNNESFDLFEINKMTNIADVLVDGDTVLTELVILSKFMFIFQTSSG